MAESGLIPGGDEGKALAGAPGIASRGAGGAGLAAVAAITLLLGSVLLIVGLAVGASWIPFLLGQRVVGRVVASEGRHFVRYGYALERRFFSGEVGQRMPGNEPQPPGEWMPGATIDLLVDRADPIRSLPVEQIEPLEILPLAGLGMLFLGYGLAGLLLGRGAGFDHATRLLAALRGPLTVLICSLLALAILSWCAPLEIRWAVGSLAWVAETGLLGYSLFRVVSEAAGRSDPRDSDEGDAAILRFPAPRRRTPLSRAA